MRKQKVHTLILGAGPSGLAAGYMLAKAGQTPVVLERDEVCGGLMRSVKRGEFTVDLGRKELYNRLAKVDALWSEILGSDYRDYPHRGGIFCQGHIIDASPQFRGFRRGMPWGMFIGCSLDFLLARLNARGAQPRNVEEYFYQARGRRLTQLSQGFQEKLTGRKWADIIIPKDNSKKQNEGFASTVKQALVRAFSKKEVNTYDGIWRHPAKGSGQICETLAREIIRMGGRIHYQAKMNAIASSEGMITSATAEIDGKTIIFEPDHVVSSVPPQFLKQLLFPAAMSVQPAGSTASKGPDRKRTVVLVYLFLNEEPRFPHAWLNVTCPSTRIGRITNYSGFNGEMVPEGKTCLCCEFYCFGPDPFLDLDDQEIAEMAIDNCARSGLIDSLKCFDRLVLRFPGADASQNRDNWMSKSRLQLLAEFEQFKNLYYVNRTETDVATLAGIDAAEAILSGNRTNFDRRMDPSEIGIRTELKTFEFQLPVSADD